MTLDVLTPENHARLLAQLRRRDEIIFGLREKTTTNELLRMLARDVLADVTLPEKYHVQARKALGLTPTTHRRRRKR